MDTLGTVLDNFNRDLAYMSESASRTSKCQFMKFGLEIGESQLRDAAVAKDRPAFKSVARCHGKLLWYLGEVYVYYQQYEKAIRPFEAMLVLGETIFGNDAELHNAGVYATLAEVRKQSHGDRSKTSFDSKFRMCNHCEKVGQIGEVGEEVGELEGCPCLRAWYCNTECQLKDWPTHRRICNMCAYCNAVAPNMPRCSCCKSVKYCDVRCQKAHLQEHKGECVALEK